MYIISRIIYDDLWFDTGVEFENETVNTNNTHSCPGPINATIIDPASRFWEANEFKVRIFTILDYLDLSIVDIMRYQTSESYIEPL